MRIAFASPSLWVVALFAALFAFAFIAHTRPAGVSLFHHVAFATAGGAHTGANRITRHFAWLTRTQGAHTESGVFGDGQGGEGSGGLTAMTAHGGDGSFHGGGSTDYVGFPEPKAQNSLAGRDTGGGPGPGG